MRIHIIGGGPGGLYLALLLKKSRPDYHIEVFERNPRDNTFGFGVVFSARTLENLEQPDPVSYQAFRKDLQSWRTVDIIHRKEKVSIGGNRFCGIARIALLHAFQDRCAGLGVKLHFEYPVLDPEPHMERADLVVGADGIGSAVREHFRDIFLPQLQTERNHYIWLGTEQLFHGLTLIFRQHPDGLFIAHSYKYSPEGSTFIVECDPASFERAGLADQEEADTLRYLEEVFQDDLEGATLHSNESRWLHFLTLKNQRWHHHNVVLLGDSLHTAHFSIGSGTKLALEDSLALAAALLENEGDVPAALRGYEQQRRPEVAEYQRAARESLNWFEQVDSLLHLPPVALAYEAMTRSSRVEEENVRRRDPEFMATYDRWAGSA